ncbi:hypothetical protein Tcan_10044 [Toxocara canis]|uniref:Uncharacterized protein n=1 Tax=Toxocara canis TaxID=6265 RepID=A0A0B2W3L8_TOXCA|nr:hypothetical protein Tcan_10044 [Toxocara canis]
MVFSYQRCGTFSIFSLRSEHSSDHITGCVAFVTLITTILALIDFIFVVALHLSCYVQVIMICVQFCLIHAIRRKKAVWMVPFLVSTAIKVSCVILLLLISLKSSDSDDGIFGDEISHLICGPIWFVVNRLRNYYGSNLSNTLPFLLFVIATSMDLLFLFIIAKYFYRIWRPAFDFSYDLFEDSFDEDFVVHYCRDGETVNGAIESYHHSPKWIILYLVKYYYEEQYTTLSMFPSIDLQRSQFIMTHSQLDAESPLQQSNGQLPPITVSNAGVVVNRIGRFNARRPSDHFRRSSIPLDGLTVNRETFKGGKAERITAFKPHDQIDWYTGPFDTITANRETFKGCQTERVAAKRPYDQLETIKGAHDMTTVSMESFKGLSGGRMPPMIPHDQIQKGSGTMDAHTVSREAFKGLSSGRMPPMIPQDQIQKGSGTMDAHTVSREAFKGLSSGRMPPMIPHDQIQKGSGTMDAHTVSRETFKGKRVQRVAPFMPNDQISSIAELTCAKV